MRGLRELPRSLSKLAQLSDAPKTSSKISGCTRKKFATMRSAVGQFVGPDVLHAVLAFDVYHTTHNISWLQFVAVRAVIAEAQHY